MLEYLKSSNLILVKYYGKKSFKIMINRRPSCIKILDSAFGFFPCGM